MERELYEVLSTAWGQPLPLDLASVVAKKMSRASVKKGDFLLRPGEINNRLFYLQRGRLRAYYIHEGVEITSWIKSESEFAVSISSFYTQDPSIEFIHAVEDTEVFSISFDDFWSICQKHLEFAFIALVHIIPVLVEWDQWKYMRTTKDTTQRFDWYMERHADVLRGVSAVPGKYVASYLDMTPETFSKVKTKYFGSLNSPYKDGSHHHLQQ